MRDNHIMYHAHIGMNDIESTAQSISRIHILSCQRRVSGSIVPGMLSTGVWGCLPNTARPRRLKPDRC
jgi:hypothetical protein